MPIPTRPRRKLKRRRPFRFVRMRQVFCREISSDERFVRDGGVFRPEGAPVDESSSDSDTDPEKNETANRP